MSDHFARVDKNREIGDLPGGRTWLAARTGKSDGWSDPCDASQQLRHLFGKFIHPDGTGRRAQLDRNGLIRGKRFASPEAAFNSALRFGYLVDKGRDQFGRPADDKYGEMVSFVAGLKLSSGLRVVLDELCEVTSCPHVPVASTTVQ